MPAGAVPCGAVPIGAVPRGLEEVTGLTGEDSLEELLVTWLLVLGSEPLVPGAVPVGTGMVELQ